MHITDVFHDGTPVICSCYIIIIDYVTSIYTGLDYQLRNLIWYTVSYNHSIDDKNSPTYFITKIITQHNILYSPFEKKKNLKNEKEKHCAFAMERKKLSFDVCE